MDPDIKSNVKPSLWRIDDCSYVWLYTDIKTLAWNQTFEARKAYNSTVSQHQNPGLKPGLWCRKTVHMFDCIPTLKPWLETRSLRQGRLITVVQYPNIIPLAWSLVFGAWKTVHMFDRIPTSKPWLEARSLVHGRLFICLIVYRH